MPEGDSLRRIAATLTQAIVGQVLLDVQSGVAAVDPAKIRGLVVRAIEARGKNLLIDFDDGLCLHTHLRMTGSWHIYRPGERWQKPAHLACVVLVTAPFVAVCFNAPVVRLSTRRALEADPQIATLGPDVLATDFDAAAAVRGLRALGHLPIGEAVMVQSALAGIGNIYKSETLFACRVDPFAATSTLDDAALDGIVHRARRLMLPNLSGPQRTTTDHLGSRFWVYQRSGRPCLVCGTTISMRRQGPTARSTYYCPRCQRPSSATLG